MDKMLYIAMSGAKQNMHALSVNANTLANAKTTGFKADLAQARSMQAFGEGMPARVFAMTERASQNFDSGALLTTGRSLDIAVEGEGWFAVQTADGGEAYTRNGQFTLDDTGQIVTSGSGYVVQPAITIPDNATSITVSAEGEVSVKTPGTIETQVVGQLSMSDFINPSGLDPMGQNLYLETGASGTPIQGTASLDGMGAIRQGALETSNVNVTEELVNLIESQRIYEMNSKVISAVDQMLSYVTQNL